MERSDFGAGLEYSNVLVILCPCRRPQSVIAVLPKGHRIINCQCGIDYFMAWRTQEENTESELNSPSAFHVFDFTNGRVLNNGNKQAFWAKKRVGG